jgi:hypothetical protein
MEVLVYLVLGLSIWILVPSERAALLGRVAERSAQTEQRQSDSDDAEEADPDVAAVARDR